MSLLLALLPPVENMASRLAAPAAEKWNSRALMAPMSSLSPPATLLLVWEKRGRTGASRIVAAEEEAVELAELDGPRAER